MKVCVLLSGGMDSVAALYDAIGMHEVTACLSFDYGSKHNAREIPFARCHAERHGIPHHTIALDFMDKFFKSDLLKSGGDIPEGHYAEESMKQTVVPFRNGIMLAVAAGFAESLGAEGVVIAAHSGDHAIYPDCREPFMCAMGEAMGAGTYAGIRLLRPFIAMDKAAIARKGCKLGVDFSQTWSCYKGGAIHCGVCGTCVERREAFIMAGLTDPTVYEQTPPLPEFRNTDGKPPFPDMPYRICKSLEIENGHMLSKHPDKCRFPHGHTRKVEFVVEADDLDRNDMVCDFKIIKSVVGDWLETFDHAMCMNTEDAAYQEFKDRYGDRVIGFDREDPTTEVLARVIFEHTSAALAAYAAAGTGAYPLDTAVRLVRVRVWETSSSWAEFEARS